MKKFAPFLKEIDRSFRDRLTKADLTDYTAVRLERLLKEVDSLLLGILDRLSDQLNSTWWTSPITRRGLKRRA